MFLMAYVTLRIVLDRIYKRAVTIIYLEYFSVSRVKVVD